jgi:hypothetical protein
VETVGVSMHHGGEHTAGGSKARIGGKGPSNHSTSGSLGCGRTCKA